MYVVEERIHCEGAVPITDLAWPSLSILWPPHTTLRVGNLHSYDMTSPHHLHGRKASQTIPYQESFTYDKVNNTSHSGNHHYILCYDLTYVQYSSVSSLNKNLQSTIRKGTTPDIVKTYLCRIIQALELLQEVTIDFLTEAVKFVIRGPIFSSRVAS